MAVNEGVTNRVEWRELPPSVREGIEQRLGLRVISATNQIGGFSHGLAARLRLEDGTVAFVKAVNVDDGLVERYRTEAATAAGLSQLVATPEVRFTVEMAGWFAVAFDFVEGHHPRLDQQDELNSVLAMLDELADKMTPSPLVEVPAIGDVYGSKLTCWRQFAGHGAPADMDVWALRNLDRLAELESTWSECAIGNTLLHTDLRPDNMLIRGDGSTVIVDWAWPCRGAAWIDLASLVPAIAGSGADPDPILASHRLTRDIDPAAVNAFVCGLAGYWAYNSRQPAPQRAPNLRRYQARSARISQEWLSRRLSWT